jgi:hypothetical protein
VIGQLVASVERRPRALRLILRGGANRERLIGTGQFALRRTSPGLRPGRKWREATAIRLLVLEPRAHLFAREAPRPEVPATLRG